MVGGAIGMYVGDRINELLVHAFGNFLVLTMFARGLGWMFLGIAVGLSEGIAARSLGKLREGE